VISDATTRRRLALALHAVFTLLAFPHELPLVGAFDLGLVCAWLAPAALVVGLDGLSSRSAARAAFFASFAGHLVLFHWFIVVTVGYGGMPLGLGLLSPLLPAFWVAQFSALFAALWARCAHRSGAVVWGACAWVAVDWLRGWFLGGFPWATLGYALHQDLPLLGLTRWGGVYALSFLAAAVGLALARVVLRSVSPPDEQTPSGVSASGPSTARSLAAIGLALALAHALGASLAGDGLPGAKPIRIAAIQGNIDQGEKWDAERRERILGIYLRLSARAAERGAEWIVWPETALPGSLEWEPDLRERVAALARQHRVVLVVGGMGVEFDSGRDAPSAYFDSAFVVGADGEIEARYDKTQLVPFGEFVPMRGLLGRVFHSLATGLSPTDVTPGRAPYAVEVPVPGAVESPLRAGIPICYELLFPDRVRRFVADGAGVLLAVTNDAWYGRTGAPHQFLAMTAMRSAETGRFTVRAANTGISAIIDDRGRVRERSALFEEAVVMADVPVAREPGSTFYARFGDVFAFGCILVALAGLVRDGSRVSPRKG
jgi:apolipoprotein N-acyltransferase